MLYRKIEYTIEQHSKSGSNKILLVDGARQIGKTYIIRYVGNKLFENHIFTNLFCNVLLMKKGCGTLEFHILVV